MKMNFTISKSYNNYEGNLEQKKYVKVLKEFFWELSYIIIRDRYKFNIPRMGCIYIKRRKNIKEKKEIDYKFYKETGKIRFQENLHSDGYHFMFVWEKPKAYNHFFNKIFYKFTAIRGEDRIIGKRGLAAWVKKCAEDPALKDYTTI